jgi:SAM-dependent methyltransferase
MAYRTGAVVPPQGETEASIRAYLDGFRPAGAPEGSAQERTGYLGDLRRFLYTLQLVPHGRGKLLEVGAHPYFTTLLLKRFRSYELTLTNGTGGSLHGNTDTLVNASGNALAVEYSRFNMETDELPFEPGSFDVVLCCEVLEHMTSDPLAGICRLNEALKLGGVLVFTTPNAARLGNVVAQLRGTSMADRYSGYGPYGRHNREYTGREVRDLLVHGAFRVDEYFTADVHDDPRHRIERALLRAGLSLWKGRNAHLGFYQFAVATKVGPANTCKPRWLYQSFDESEMCDG